MPNPRYAVGIDLGTTNSVLGYLSLKGTRPPIDLLSIPQLVGVGSVHEQTLLPSFLYFAGPELPKGSTRLPWTDSRDFIVGEFARVQGLQVPIRLVSSAKSWLCHSGVDRRGPVLPWQAPMGLPRISPLQASARFLEHMREAWDFTRPGEKLVDQEIVLTVPASFDAIGRELTVEAARHAGLVRLTLLEEPQAALYAWLEANGKKWRRQLFPGDVVLVVDVGGGTTDFSLIAVLEEEGQLSLERIAVGDHILLGGDNMDAALARITEERLALRKALDAWQFRALTFGCRDAKERLLSDGRRQTYSVVIPSRGSSLFGSALDAEITRDDVMSVVLDGFFPITALDEYPREPEEIAKKEHGLPFASDSAISRHLAQFLGRQRGATERFSGIVGAMGRRFLHPSAVLFNGGALTPKILRQRIVEILNNWVESDGGKAVRILESASLDLAVARGAAYYARVHHGSGRGVRIRGGTARAYYLGVESRRPAEPQAVPRLRAFCVAPFGMEEGTAVEMADKPFGLVVGEPVEFRFLASSTRRNDKVGDAVDDLSELEELPPISTTLEGASGKIVPIHIKARVTEVGTLLLWCVERQGDKLWKVEFNVRITDEDLDGSA
jgi:molecular chaperone DnaK (HSP70)